MCYERGSRRNGSRPRSKWLPKAPPRPTRRRSLLTVQTLKPETPATEGQQRRESLRPTPEVCSRQWSEPKACDLLPGVAEDSNQSESVFDRLGPYSGRHQGLRITRGTHWRCATPSDRSTPKRVGIHPHQQADPGILGLFAHRDRTSSGTPRWDSPRWNFRWEFHSSN